MVQFPLNDHESHFMEKKLSIFNYKSSESLKNEIRKSISDYGKMGCNLINISSKGQFIHLEFEHKK